MSYIELSGTRLIYYQVRPWPMPPSDHILQLSAKVVHHFVIEYSLQRVEKSTLVFCYIVLGVSLRGVTEENLVGSEENQHSVDFKIQNKYVLLSSSTTPFVA